MPKITFHAESDNPNTAWVDNIQSAFHEFFRAKQTQANQIARIVRRAEQINGPRPVIGPELGHGKENAFKSRNGIFIWFETKS